MKYVTHKNSLTLGSCENMLVLCNALMNYLTATAKMPLIDSLKAGEQQIPEFFLLFLQN